MTVATNSGPVFVESNARFLAHVDRETVIVDQQTILLERPTDADNLVDDPAVREANVKDDYMPYWAEIWPAARMLAKAILREPAETFATPSGEPLLALELGCGLGLAGIAALKCGLRVLFTDYDLSALKFAERNAKLNGFANFQTMPLDWRFPPDDLRVPIIIGADLSYELRNIDPLLALIKKMLLPGGVCLLTDPDRKTAPTLRERLAAEGMVYSTHFMRTGVPGGERTKGTLYRIAGESPSIHECEFIS